MYKKVLSETDKHVICREENQYDLAGQHNSVERTSIKSESSGVNSNHKKFAHIENVVPK